MHRYRLMAYVSVGWAEDQGMRNEMEDKFVAVENFGRVHGDLFVGVFDGHGGKSVAAALSERMHSVLQVNLQRNKDDEAEVLRDTCIEVDEQIRKTIPTSGATACMCLFRQESDTCRLYCAHLGDARAVIGRANGSCQRLTCSSDHKATDPSELVGIAHRRAYVFNDRVLGSLAVSRAFGDAELKQPHAVSGELYDPVSNVPDVSVVELCPEGKLGDRFCIIACDGLWDVVSDETAVLLVTIVT
eukprot:GHVQ01008190.1.p1 GENE.GHVQ01008190.1~~GHVQ01008190.1.p1  ORF type:complete len:244 (-),score=29.76 GHVQ01008190.1:1769-2500(-)